MILLLFINFVLGCRILSLSGGGAHGAFQAGVINKLHDEGRKWDIITGISVGSLNGIMLSMFNQSQQSDGIELMRDVWFNITDKQVYKWYWNPFYHRSLLDSSPLNNTIRKYAFKYGGIAKRDIMIGATNLNTGLLDIFRMSDFNDPSRSSQIVMASTAIPAVFPPVYLDGHFYIDGGTYSNELVRPAIKHCLNNGYVKSDIVIDIIICSAPIMPITNKEIESDYIFGMMSRSYDILSNSISNHEIYTECHEYQDVFPMYVYKPYSPYPGNLLDFNSKTLAKTFKIGYNIKKPNRTLYCY